MKCETPPKPFPRSENCTISPAAHRNGAVPKKLPETAHFVPRGNRTPTATQIPLRYSPLPNPKHAANNGHVGASKSIAACSKHPWSLQSGRTASYASPRLSPGSGAERCPAVLPPCCRWHVLSHTPQAAEPLQVGDLPGGLPRGSPKRLRCRRCAPQARTQQSRGSSRSRRARVSSSR